MNGIMTLGDIVDAGNKGRDDRQRQDQYQRGLKQQQLGDQANSRASDVFRASMDGGEDRDIAMLRASEAFGQQFAEAGQWQDYLKHEASVQPQRMRVRAQALQQYQADKDVEKLLRKVYATVPDGNDIESIEQIEGGAPVDRGTAPTAAKTPPRTLADAQAGFDTEVMNPLGVKAETPPVVNPGRPGDGRLGAPSGPAALRVRLKNGEVRPVDINGLLQGLQQSLQDPVKAAEQEIELNFLRAKKGVEAQSQISVEQERGRQARQTETLRGTNQAARDERVGAQRLTLAEAQGDNRVEVAQVGAAARVATAGTRAAGGGGGRGGSNGFQRTFAGSDGFMYGIPKQGGDAVRIEIKGQPVRTNEWGKRVDQVAKQIATTRDGAKMTPVQLREAAEVSLAAGVSSKPVQTKPAGGATSSAAQAAIDKLLGN